MITVSTLKNKLSGKIRGASLDKVANVYGKIGEAAKTMLSRIDPETTIRRHRIQNAIYDQVYNYTAPTDLKTPASIIDLRPIAQRISSDDISGRFSKEFDIRKETDTLTVETINGINTVRLSKNLTPRTVLHTCDSATLGGTVTAGGDVTDLTTDTLNYISGNASLRFNLSGATGVGTLTFALDNGIDLSDLEDLGALFAWLQFPLASALTSVKLEWGTDASNNWSKTVTAAHDRAWESNAFMLLSHSWNDATETGTPDSDAIVWLRITINYTSGTARNNVYVDNITAALGQAWEIMYYSGYLFTDSTGTTWKAEPTADSDIIMVDGTCENILLYECKQILADELKGKNMARDIELCQLMLDGNNNRTGLYDLYEENHPSQALEQQTTYYDFGDLND